MQRNHDSWELIQWCLMYVLYLKILLAVRIFIVSVRCMSLDGPQIPKAPFVTDLGDDYRCVACQRDFRTVEQVMQHLRTSKRHASLGCSHLGGVRSEVPLNNNNNNNNKKKQKKKKKKKNHNKNHGSHNTHES